MFSSITTDTLSDFNDSLIFSILLFNSSEFIFIDTKVSDNNVFHFVNYSLVITSKFYIFSKNLLTVNLLVLNISLSTSICFLRNTSLIPSFISIFEIFYLKYSIYSYSLSFFNNSNNVEYISL